MFTRSNGAINPRVCDESIAASSSSAIRRLSLQLSLWRA